MELRQLELFRVLAQERHFGRTAQRLFLGQPTVTQQLQRLEAEVGVRLVHRTSRRVELTAAGQAFLVEVEQVLEHAARAVEVARRTDAADAGALRIAANYPASRLLLLPLLERLRLRQPQVSTVLRELSTDDQLSALARGELDLGLGYGPIDHPELLSQHLLDVAVVATVRHGHPLAGREAVHYRELAQHAYLTGFRGSGRRIESVLLQTAASHGVRLTPSEASSDLTSYLLELEATDAVGFCSAPRGEQNRASGMHVLQLLPTAPLLQVHVVVNRHLVLPSTQAVVQQLTELARTTSR